MPSPARADQVPARRRMRPKTRRLVLVVHVIVSVGALGLYLGLLTLAITGLTTDDPETLRTAYLAMGIFRDALIIPINLAVLASGLVLALGTPWGLLRHYWVLIKFVLTLGLATASTFGLRARIAEAIDNLPVVPTSAPDVGTVGILLVVLLPIALGIYVTTTVLAIYKPWGMTRRARRSHQAAESGGGRRA